MKTKTGDLNFLAIKYEKYGVENLFMMTLKRKIDHYFSSNNISKYGNGFVGLKIALVLSIFFGSYALLISNKFSPATDLLLGIVCGISTVLIVMNIGHDAAHNALSRNKKINHFFSWSIELAGLSHAIWKINHNIIHHPYPNVKPVDSEINMALPFFRLGTVYPKKWYHRYQHLYGPFIYLFFTINLIFIRDFQDSGIFRKECSQRVVKHFPYSHYAILFISKLFYIGYALVLPMLLLSVVWWKVLLAFLFIHFVMSIMEMCVQLPLHVNEQNKVVEINTRGIIPNNWELHMLESTCDYLPESKIANFITGGINTHTIHHFFPGICHIHYRALTKILADTSKELDFPYRCVPWAKGMASHFRQLKQLAMEP